MVEKIQKNLNRIIAALSILAGLAAAVVPAVADYDWQSTGGVIAGVAAIALTVNKFLDGWQQYEERIGAGLEDIEVTPPGDLPDGEPIA